LMNCQSIQAQTHNRKGGQMPKINALTFFIALSIMVGIFAIGCSSGGQRVQIPNDSELSAKALEGKRLVEERCTACHTLDRVYAEKEDKAGWTDEVDEMIEKGAKLNAEEREKVIEYLAGLKPLES